MMDIILLEERERGEGDRDSGETFFSIFKHVIFKAIYQYITKSILPTAETVTLYKKQVNTKTRQNKKQQV